MKVFISHASEDKDSFVRSLAEALRGRRLDVWYDEYVLRIGDSLRESIDRGLASCDYGIVVLSKSFFAKRWPTQELNGLFGRDLASDRRFLLPIKHEISIGEIREYSPILADRFMISTSEDLTKIVEHILAVMGGDEFQLRVEGKIVRRLSYAHRYYNPPGNIPEFGYELKPGSFDELATQLRSREVIIAYGDPYGTHYSAAHIPCEERMLELEKDWNSAPRYFAVDIRKLVGGFDLPMPSDEIAELLGLPHNHNKGSL